jgi:hypothetical protein
MDPNTFDVTKGYQKLNFHKDRLLDHSELNEWQDIQLTNEKLLAAQLYGEVAVYQPGTVAANTGTSTLSLSNWQFLFRGRILRPVSASLTIPTGTGLATVYVQVDIKTYTVVEDASLIDVDTQQPISERQKWVASMDVYDHSGDTLPSGTVERKVVAAFSVDRTTLAVVQTINSVPDSVTFHNAIYQTSPKSTTVTIAAYNSSPSEARFADYKAADATTDLGVMINSAIAALPSEGGEIKLLSGDYIISSPVALIKSHITIIGMGRSTKIKNNVNVYDKANEAEALFFINPGDVSDGWDYTLEGFGLKNMAFYATQNPGSFVPASILHVKRTPDGMCNDITVDGISVTGHQYNASDTANPPACNGWSAPIVRFSSTGQPNLVYKATNLTVKNCQVSGMDWRFIDVVSVNNVVIDSNIIDCGATSYSNQGVVSIAYGSRAIITSNQVLNGKANSFVLLKQQSSSIIAENVFVGSTVETDLVTDVMVTDNVIKGNANNLAALIVSSGSRAFIESNVALNATFAVVADYVEVMDNNVFAPETAPTSQTPLISVTKATGGTDYGFGTAMLAKIQGNTIYSKGSTIANWVAISASNGAVISQNLILPAAGWAAGPIVSPDNSAIIYDNVVGYAVPSTAQNVYGEIPTKDAGDSKINTTAHTFVPASLRVYKNGLRLALTTDYTVASGNNGFTLVSTPSTGDVILVDYDRNLAI